MENENAFKHLFSEALLARLAKAICKVHPSFSATELLKVWPSLKSLEMKPRVRAIRDEFQRLLPDEYLKALLILRRAAQDASLQGFDLWPISEFVQTYGLDHPKESLDALRELTPKFSSEFAVRPYLRLHARTTLAFLKQCSGERDVHLRRWASEGSRPRLPWGERLQALVKDPTPTFPILEKLKFDSELYVRKSVANHLNDIAKDHPKLVLKLLSDWKREADGEDGVKIAWIIRHSLRTLIKNGHSDALKLIGVSSDADVKISRFNLSAESARIGEKIDFSFRISSLEKKSQKIVIDYAIHYARANGSFSAKVFKLKTFVLEPGREIEIFKSHSLKEVTTRKYYLGEHALSLQVNGKVVKRVSWNLTA